jgi:hypothetical protein
MLSPETIKTLDEALTAVVDELGDDPAGAGLKDALTAAQGELGHMSGDHGDDAGADAPEDDDPHSFDFAEKQMTKRRSGKPDPKDAA